MDRSCTLLNASAVLLWLWKTNKQLVSRSSMKERTYFSGCLQVLASQCAIKYCPLCLMTSKKDVTEPLAVEARQRWNKNPCRTPIIYYNLYVCSTTPSTYVGLLLYVVVAPPILRLRKNSNSRVIQILIKRMDKQYIPGSLFPLPQRAWVRGYRPPLLVLAYMTSFSHMVDLQWMHVYNECMNFVNNNYSSQNSSALPAKRLS